MPEIGYKLCSEEQSPQERIDCARRAEEVGFDFAMISDHYHPPSPDKELKREFEKAGGKRKPCYAEAPVCWADDEAKARGAAHAYWPTAPVTGELSQVLPVPAHFENAAKMVKEEDVAKEIVRGPDPERYIAKINEYVEAGYDHMWLHQVWPDQEGFFRFFEKEVLPKLDHE